MPENTMPDEDREAARPDGGNISLTNEKNVELLTFAPCDMTAQSIKQLPSLTDASIGQFNEMLRNVPALASLSAANSDQLVLCNLDFDKLIEAKDGAGRLGIVRKPASNQFGEHVRLNTPDELRSIVTTGMIFNIASTLVAQKHLADISKKLDRIQDGIKQIAAYQQNERTAVISAAHEQIQSSMQRLARGQSIHETTATRLSQHLTQLRSIALHLKRDFGDSFTELGKVGESSIFGSAAIREDIEQAVEKTGRMYTEYMLTMQCLVMTNAILFFHHGFDDEFREDAQRYLAELEATDGIVAQWERYRKNVRVKLDKIHPFFEFAHSTQANIILAEKTLSKVQNQLLQERTHLSQIAEMLLPRKQSRIVLEINGGQIVGGKYLA